MKSKPNNPGQTNFLYQRWEEQLDPKHALYRLANKIDWDSLDGEFESFYSKKGRPAHPVRLMAALLFLKQMYDVSDEDVVAHWPRRPRQNPYWQYFSGIETFQWKFPTEPSDLTHFRERIGKTGADKILKLSIAIHERQALDNEVLVDTTVQEKKIAYPTDARLQKKAIDQCLRIAEKEGLKLRRTYTRTSKTLLRTASPRRTAKQKKTARKATKSLRGIAGRLTREIERTLTAKQIKPYLQDLLNICQVLYQKRGDKHKIYSLHVPEVQCIAKGKAHKRFEFGSKASISVTLGSGIVVGALSFKENIYGGHTLDKVKKQIAELTGEKPKAMIAGRGYRGRKKIGSTEILVPGSQPGASVYRKRQLKKRFRKRAGIEAFISHLKLDHRMGRNYLKGVAGAEINVAVGGRGVQLNEVGKAKCLIFCPFSIEVT